MRAEPQHSSTNESGGLWFTLAVERDGPLVPGQEDSLVVRWEVWRVLDREAGRGVDGAQAVVGSAGVQPTLTSAWLTHTENTATIRFHLTYIISKKVQHRASLQVRVRETPPPPLWSSPDFCRGNLNKGFPHHHRVYLFSNKRSPDKKRRK